MKALVQCTCVFVKSQSYPEEQHWLWLDKKIFTLDDYAKTLTAAGLIIDGVSVNHLKGEPENSILKSSGQKKETTANTALLSFITLALLQPNK